MYATHSSLLHSLLAKISPKEGDGVQVKTYRLLLRKEEDKIKKDIIYGNYNVPPFTHGRASFFNAIYHPHQWCLF